MADSLFFNMGEYRAVFPADRLYASNHMWGAVRGRTLRFGFTAYAVRLLQDVYFLDWVVAAGADVAEREEIGQIESKKAEASLYAPMAGRIVRFNEELLHDPSAINIDGYGSGWLFEMAGIGAGLLSPREYIDHLAAAWEVTQRTIKGQGNK